MSVCRTRFGPIDFLAPATAAKFLRRAFRGELLDREVRELELVGMGNLGRCLSRFRKWQQKALPILTQGRNGRSEEGFKKQPKDMKMCSCNPNPASWLGLTEAPVLNQTWKRTEKRRGAVRRRFLDSGYIRTVLTCIAASSGLVWARPTRV